MLSTMSLANAFAPLLTSNMGYVWYLGAQALFLMVFNWLQDLKRSSPRGEGPREQLKRSSPRGATAA